MIYRVFTKPDEQIVIEGFSPEIDLVAAQQLPHPKGCEGLTPIYTDSLPETDHLDKIYIENGELKVDSDWSRKLMPKEEIFKKHRDRTLKKIDDELQKQNPDSIALMAYQRSIEKLKEQARFRSKADKSLYEQALANLNERVEKGESDKALIRQKLMEKISEANSI